MPVIKSSTETRVRTTYRLSGREILSLIPGLQPTDNACVEFHVPSGGDYSGMALPVTEEDPVVVTVERWITQEEEI